MWIYLVTALTAICTSVGWRWYIRSTARNHVWSASGADLVILLSGSLSAQLWAIDHNDFRVLITYDSVAVITTLIIGLLSKRKRKGLCAR